MEHEEQAEHMEEEAERMEHHSDELGDRIDDVKEDWERKEHDASVPGAQPDPDDEEEPVPGVDADEEVVSEEGGP
jgi:Mn-dependent DtxR family transcriptional regulator